MPLPPAPPEHVEYHQQLHQQQDYQRQALLQQQQQQQHQLLQQQQHQQHLHQQQQQMAFRSPHPQYGYGYADPAVRPPLPSHPQGYHHAHPPTGYAQQAHHQLPAYPYPSPLPPHYPPMELQYQPQHPYPLPAHPHSASSYLDQHTPHYFAAGAPAAAAASSAAPLPHQQPQQPSITHPPAPVWFQQLAQPRRPPPALQSTAAHVRPAILANAYIAAPHVSPRGPMTTAQRYGRAVAAAGPGASSSTSTSPPLLSSAPPRAGGGGIDYTPYSLRDWEELKRRDQTTRLPASIGPTREDVAEFRRAREATLRRQEYGEHVAQVNRDMLQHR